MWNKRSDIIENILKHFCMWCSVFTCIFAIQNNMNLSQWHVIKLCTSSIEHLLSNKSLMNAYSAGLLRFMKAYPHIFYPSTHSEAFISWCKFLKFNGFGCIIASISSKNYISVLKIHKLFSWTPISNKSLPLVNIVYSADLLSFMNT